MIARRTNLRWVAPAAAAGLVIASPGLWSTFASAEPVLPPRTADEIIADVLTAKPVAFSGEVVQSMDLGLPGLGYETGVDFNDPNLIWSLASGTNTWRLWYDGDRSYRVAMIRGQSESDLISNGSVLWAWSSQSQTAVRTELEASTHSENHPVPAGSPQEAAREVLREFEQYSAVTTDANLRVAGRAAYELVITPDDPNTRVAQVRLAVDAETSMPLRLVVSSTTTGTAAIEIGFTKISYTQPNASVFEFTPPPTAEVIDAGRDVGELPADAAQPDSSEPRPPEDDLVPADRPRPVTHGEGWSQVTVTPSLKPEGSSSMPVDNPFTQMLPRTQGEWGSGVVFDGTLVSMVLTDDGRMAFGAVAPEALYQALGR